MTKIYNVICLDSVVKVYDIDRHKDLLVDLKNITDKNNTDAWKVEDVSQVSSILILLSYFSASVSRFIITV